MSSCSFQWFFFLSYFPLLLFIFFLSSFFLLPISSSCSTFSSHSLPSSSFISSSFLLFLPSSIFSHAVYSPSVHLILFLLTFIPLSFLLSPVLSILLILSFSPFLILPPFPSHICSSTVLCVPSFSSSSFFSSLFFLFLLDLFIFLYLHNKNLCKPVFVLVQFYIYNIDHTKTSRYF